MYATISINDEEHRIHIGKCNSTFATDNCLESDGYDEIWYILEKLSNDEIINLRSINVYHRSGEFINCFLPKNDAFIDKYLITIFLMTQRSIVQLPVEIAQIILCMIIKSNLYF